MKTYPIKNPISFSKNGLFGNIRKHDVHTGVDIYCTEHSEVFALEKGVVKKVSPFTGDKAGSPWWENTEYIGIISNSGYIVYGEVSSLVQEGDIVEQGQIIGTVKKVLKKDKGLPTSMLHIELYSQYVEDPVIWELNSPKPSYLKDPTSLFNLPRFDHDCENYLEIVNYIKNREKQLLSEGVILDFIEQANFGAVIVFIQDNIRYNSIFIYPSFRNQGVYLDTVKQLSYPILTVDDCLIVDYLTKKGIRHKVFGNFLNNIEYKLISDFYLDQKAQRSGLYLMNHVDEGLKILTDLGVSEDVKKAFCIHPLVQSDKDLSDNLEMVVNSGVSKKALAFALEYRSVANEYLSKRKINSIDDIRLSPLDDVNKMLIADKIQNYKDFLLYNESHHRYSELDQYFKNWLLKLKISNQEFENYKKLLK